MSLIQTLNGLADKTPDQIVQQLNKKGWVRFGDLTDAQFEFYAEKYMVLYDHTRLEMHNLPVHQWVFWGNRTERDRERFRVGLKNFWGILTEEYNDGDLPYIATERRR